MRAKIQIAPTFPMFIDSKQLEIVADYQKKYDTISGILDSSPKILNLFHEDLKQWGSEDGRESSFSSEHFLRALLVKTIEGLSFRETIIRISDSSILRNFTRLNSGNVMNFTMLDTAFKKISAQTWEKINALLAKWATNSEKISTDRFRLDSTVCESNIHHPTDASLLWDCYRAASRTMEQLREVEPALILGHRFHDTKVKKLYTFIATHNTKKNKSTARKVKKTKIIFLHRVETICEIVRSVIENGKKRSRTVESLLYINDLEVMLPKIDQVIEQSCKAFNGEKVPASARIFSIFEDHTELLIRGKQHKPVEFGHLVQIGQTGEKFISFYAVEQKSRHDSEMLEVALNDHKKTFGEFPNEFSADKNYYKSMDQINDWEKEIDVFSVCKKGGRTPEERAREHGLLFKLAQKFRAGCEGSISVLKRVYGLRRCLNRGFNSFAAAIGCLVFCHNVVLLSRL
jgi:IS5 family transposase